MKKLILFGVIAIVILTIVSGPTQPTLNQSENVTEENCKKVNSDMTKEEIIALLGEPASSSESELTSGYTTEMLTFLHTEGFSGQSCTITLTNGSVSSKSWTEI